MTNPAEINIHGSSKRVKFDDPGTSNEKNWCGIQGGAVSFVTNQPLLCLFFEFQRLPDFQGRAVSCREGIFHW